ncbi:MAG TPA: glycosyltransferase family 4 protein [Anaerovoracaceae bacterium]|nr:glycosyltransferase family 4 protein [Anaerovoracaceae bacterium]
MSIIDRTRADIVCCHEPKSVFLANLIRLARRNVKIVGCSRGWTHENWKVRQYERIERFLLRYVDHVVAVSHGQKAKLLQVGVPDRKITVIHNAVEMKEVHGFCQLRVELGLPVDSVLIATAGRLSPEKNHIGMIEVAQHVVSEHSKAFFLVFGEGVLRKELEERVDAAGLHGRFLLPGFRIDLPNVLRQIDIFMLPSFTEGLPNVILEAYVARKPVVATDVGGTPEIVEEGKSGFVTKPGELKKMAGHVSRLVASPELRAAFGNAGYRHVQQHFNLDLQADRYARLYGSLHNGRNAST